MISHLSKKRLNNSGKYRLNNSVYVADVSSLSLSNSNDSKSEQRKSSLDYILYNGG